MMVCLRALAMLVTCSCLATIAGCSSGSRDAVQDSAAGASAPASSTGTPTDSTAAGASTRAATDQQGTMLDPNTATREQLVAVKGMTPAAADALLAGRPYADMIAVNAVLLKQLGDAERKQVYATLWKPIDLNSAKGEEILLIPGVGPRMRHEFEEYRPYTNIEQFRREIGKYVDKNEVARLEKYVTIR